MNQHTRVKLERTQDRLTQVLIKLVLDGRGSTFEAVGVATSIRVNSRVLNGEER